MNSPGSTPVNVTLTVTTDGKGNLQYAWSGNGVDAKGNLDLTKIQTTIVVTITISTSLQVSFFSPPAQALWIGKQTSGPPTGPYTGTEFTSAANVNSASTTLQWTDQNSDGTTYAYILILWLVNAANPKGVQVKLDPRIINRGTSG
jgi:hypothetical protein